MNEELSSYFIYRVLFAARGGTHRHRLGECHVFAFIPRDGSVTPGEGTLPNMDNVEETYIWYSPSERKEIGDCVPAKVLSTPDGDGCVMVEIRDEYDQAERISINVNETKSVYM